MKNKSKTSPILERVSFYTCCLFCIFIPIPLFIDGLSTNLVLQNTSFPKISNFPIPVGLITFSMMFLIFYLNSIFFRNKYKLLISDKKNRLVLILISLLFFTWSTFITKNNILRVIQLVLPIVLLLLVAFPTDYKRSKILTYCYLFSIFFFLTTHILSIYSANNTLLRITEYEYALYFNYGIYQAFVSFPGVLALAFCLVSFLLFIERGFFIRLFLSALWISILISLGMAARRISLFETLLTVLGLSLFLLIHISIKHGKILKKYFISVFIMTCIITITFPFFIKMPILVRAVNSAESGTFDSGRFDIYQRAIQVLQSDYYFLIFGYGGHSGFHNYFLDIIYSMGLLPFVTAIFLLMFFFKTGMFSKSKMKDISFYLLLSVLGCLVLQSLLNTSITQPLYVCNFIMVILISVFYTNFNKTLKYN